MKYTRYRITKEGHKVIKTAVEAGADWNNLAPEDKESCAEVAEGLLILKRASKDGVYSFIDSFQLREDDLSLLQLSQLEKHHLIEKVDKVEDEKPLGDLEAFAYEKDVELRYKEIREELEPYILSHETPPVDIQRRYYKVIKELNKLVGRGYPF